MSILPGIRPFAHVAAGGGSVTITFLASYSDASNFTSYTFSSLSFGAADDDRVLAVAVCGRRNSAGSIASVTVGGVTATAIATAINSAGGSDLSAIYAANVPSGTSGDVVVTFSGAYLRCAIGLYSISGTGGSVTATDTATTSLSGSDPSTTIDVAENGAVLAAAWATFYAGAATTTWVGVTEDYDTQPETPSNAASAGHEDTMSAETGRTITADFTGTVAECAMAVASWSPA